MAVIGGLTRLEGAWVGAFAFIVINNYVRDVSSCRVIGGSFNTIIGLIFLVIVIVSPDGLMGVWDRLWRSLRRRGGGTPATRPELARLLRRRASRERRCWIAGACDVDSSHDASNRLDSEGRAQ